MTTRRNFLGLMAGAATIAPIYVKAGILMPVRKIVVPAPVMPMEIGEWSGFQIIESPLPRTITLPSIVRFRKMVPYPFVICNTGKSIVRISDGRLLAPGQTAVAECAEGRWNTTT